MANIDEVKFPVTNQSNRILHKLSDEEKKQGSIFTKQAEIGFRSMVVTYKDFNNDGYIEENEVYKITDYSSYKTKNGETVTIISERGDLDGDGNADLNTRTRVKNGKIIDVRKLPLEWVRNLVQDARVAWREENNIIEYNFE